MEDFWTRSIAEMKDDIDTQPKSQLYIKKRNRGRTLLANFLVTLVAKFGLHSWLIPMRIWLQKLIIYLSKACWSLSEFVLRMIRPFIMNSEKISLLSGLNWSGVRCQLLVVHLIYSVLDAFCLPFACSETSSRRQQQCSDVYKFSLLSG
jgi:hypothetical protein